MSRLVCFRLSLIALGLIALTGCAPSHSFAGDCSSDAQSPAAPAAATSSTTNTPSPVAAVVNVQITNFAYDPPVVTVPPGTTVLWTNKDSINHTVSSGTPSKPAGIFGGKLATEGSTYSYKFDTPGEYPYYCDFHPSMSGTVIVKQP